jgi:hypothetical protein
MDVLLFRPLQETAQVFIIRLTPLHPIASSVFVFYCVVCMGVLDQHQVFFRQDFVWCEC